MLQMLTKNLQTSTNPSVHKCASDEMQAVTTYHTCQLHFVSSISTWNLEETLNSATQHPITQYKTANLTYHLVILAQMMSQRPDAALYSIRIASTLAPQNPGAQFRQRREEAPTSPNHSTCMHMPLVSCIDQCNIPPLTSSYCYSP